MDVRSVAWHGGNEEKLEPTVDPMVWRPITGWDATEEGRRHYREEY
jgi:hypothetical protein